MQTNSDVDILVLNATDLDSGANGEVTYSLKTMVSGFSIEKTTGTLYANTSRIDKPIVNYIQLSVIAKDSGIPSLSSVATVRVHSNSNSNKRPQFLQNQYR